MPDSDLLATATATAQKLAAKPSGALLASKRLLKQASIGQLKEAIKSESQELMERVTAAEAKEALSAFSRSVRRISTRRRRPSRPTSPA